MNICFREVKNLALRTSGSFGICDWSLSRWKTSSPRFKIKIIYQNQYQILFSNPWEKLTIINFKIKAAKEFTNNKLKVVIKKFNISNNLKLFFNPRDWKDSNLAFRRGTVFCNLILWRSQEPGEKAFKVHIKTYDILNIPLMCIFVIFSLSPPVSIRDLLQTPAFSFRIGSCTFYTCQSGTLKLDPFWEIFTITINQ